MRIGIEATALCNPTQGGIQRYTRSLVGALRAAFPDDSLELFYRLSRWRQAGRRLRLDGVRSRWLHEPLLPLRKGVDVVHGTDARVPDWRGVPRLATLHDVFSIVSERFAPAAFRERKRARYRELAERCDRIVAVSERTRRDFLEAFPDVRPERVVVVAEGVDERFGPRPAAELARVRARHGLEAPYVLYVGELTARKNLVRTLQGFERARLPDGCLLALAGRPGFGVEALEAALARSPAAARVRRLGFVEEHDLPALYAAAAAFAFVSSYEGFGLPVLEAMRCGTPVVTSTTGATPEVAGGHALLADPDDPDAIAHGLEQAVALDAARREAARRHAECFTWEACARAVHALYAELAGGG